MKHAKHSRILLFGLLAFALAAQTPARRPLHHRDYDGWKSIQSQVLARDGKFLAYAQFPQEGDGELIIRDLVTGREFHENAGSVPPVPDTQSAEVPTEQVTGRGLRIVFTNDTHYLISNAFPTKAETDQAKKDKKRPEEMPKPGLLVVDLEKFHSGASALTKVADVTSYQVPEAGASYLAYLKSAKPDPAAAAAAANLSKGAALTKSFEASREKLMGPASARP